MFSFRARRCCTSNTNTFCTKFWRKKKKPVSFLVWSYNDNCRKYKEKVPEQWPLIYRRWRHAVYYLLSPRLTLLRSSKSIVSEIDGEIIVILMHAFSLINRNTDCSNDIIFFKFFFSIKIYFCATLVDDISTIFRISYCFSAKRVISNSFENGAYL